MAGSRDRRPSRPREQGARDGDARQLAPCARRAGEGPRLKTLLLLSAGLVPDGAAAELRAAQDAAAASFTRVYAIQVPTSAERFMEQGRIGLIDLARHTGGGLVTLTDRPAQALQRMIAELSFSYLLLLPPQATDADKALHTVSVRTRRKDVTIRTSTTIARGRLLPADGEAPPSPPSGGWVNVGSPSGVPRRSGPSSWRRGCTLHVRPARPTRRSKPCSRGSLTTR